MAAPMRPPLRQHENDSRQELRVEIDERGLKVRATDYGDKPCYLGLGRKSDSSALYELFGSLSC